MHCPRCQGSRVIKNGSIHNGKPKWKCKECGRQFVVASAQRLISQETRQTIDKLLLERISLAGIVRVTGVSLRWLHTTSMPNMPQLPARSVRLSKKGGLDTGM
jgi:insertion element IS1 protein InsB